MLYRTPSSPVFSLRREIDRLFDDTFGGEGTTNRRGWLPAADVRETAGDYTFELELPGVNPDDVELTADNGVLTVRGEKTQRARKEDEQGRFHFVERSFGSFVRAFQLPQGVDEDRIDATFAHGVLTVRVPKAARPQPRRIRIAEGGGEQRLATGGDGQRAAAERPAERGRVEGAGTGRRSEKREPASTGS
jgi:HSP20 family protein